MRLKYKNQYINSLNKKIKELNEIVTRNKQETNKLHSFKNSNKTLENRKKADVEMNLNSKVVISF